MESREIFRQTIIFFYLNKFNTDTKIMAAVSSKKTGDRILADSSARLLLLKVKLGQDVHIMAECIFLGPLSCAMWHN